MCVDNVFLAITGFLNFDVIGLLITILVMCLSLSVHESAHAFAALKLGDDTAYMAGRITLNPLKHLDPLGALMFIFARIGWAKPVPINPSRFTRTKSIKTGIVLTSLAGPFSNLLLGALAVFVFDLLMLIFAALGFYEATTYSFFVRLFGMLYMANMWLCVFNLLPVPPLDGYKIFGSLLPHDVYFRIMQYEQYVGIAFLVIIFLFPGAVTGILSHVIVPFDFLIRKPISHLFLLLQGLFKLQALVL